MEEVAFQQMLHKFESQNLIPINYNRQNFTIETALMNISENTLSNMKSKRCTIMTYLDLSTHCDTVNPNILLDIHKNYCGC